MFKKQFQPVPIVQEDRSELYAITTDVFHAHHLYLVKKLISKKKVVGFCLLKPNLIYENVSDETIMGKIVAVCISEKKGIQKREVGTCKLVEHFGLEGDAHAGKWHRQVSLLAKESADIMRKKGLNIKNGDFGENIVTEGIELKSLPIGTVLKIGDGIIIRVTQIGKLCHDRCAIYYKAGDCIMPRRVFLPKFLPAATLKQGMKSRYSKL